MANPQRENGHIDIANEIVDALCKHRISGQEWQILWVVLRKTWGWLENPKKDKKKKKRMDIISYSQFSELTGIPRSRCNLLINTLVEKNILIKKPIPKNGNTSLVSYGFQKDYEKWKVSPKKVTVPKNGNTLSPIMGTKSKKSVPNIGVHKRKYFKETNTKETTNVDRKKKGDPRIKELILLFCRGFEIITGEKYCPVWGKHGVIFKNLLQVYSIDKLKELMAMFFKTDSKFVKEAGYTIEIFKSQIPRLLHKTGGKYSGAKAWIKEQEEKIAKGEL